MTKNDFKQVIAQVASAHDSEDDKNKKEETLQVLVFELDNEEYALNITDLREIISIPDITPIPNAPEFIRGILNLRGKIVVVVDLEKRFGLTRENKIEPKHIVITEVEGNSFGVIVDNVEEVLRVPQSSIQMTPDLVSSKIHAEYLQGVIVVETEKTLEEECRDIKKADKKESESRLLILLDLQKLLQEKELMQLGEVVKQTVEGGDKS